MIETGSLRGLASGVRIDTPLKNRLGTVLAITFLPVPLVSLLYIGHRLLVGTPLGGYSLRTGYLVYVSVNLLTVALLYLILSPARGADVFRFRRPSWRELVAAVAAFLLGLGVFQVTATVSARLGYQMQGLTYSLIDPTAFLTIVIGAVVLAPITEETLYRGLVLGALLSRGLSAITATILMTIIFALIHLPNFGGGGTLFISV
jgi:membrane protease YdiL (CAAX protease family)